MQAAQGIALALPKMVDFKEKVCTVEIVLVFICFCFFLENLVYLIHLTIEFKNAGI